MAGAYDDNTISVSFHYFEKGHTTESGEFVVSEFSENEFDLLCEKVQKQPTPDLKDKTDFDRVKYGKIVPFSDIERKDNRTLVGRFQAAYWGHAFDNSEKGPIDPKSLNLRLFCFILYLSESGKIFVGCQYLGNYGDYTGLSSFLRRSLGAPQTIRSKSFFSDSEAFANLIPTEVRVTLHGRNSSISAGTFSRSGSVLTFRRGMKDEQFSISVRDKILSLIGRPLPEIKRLLAEILKQNEIYSVRDTDIENCVVVAKKPKSRSNQTIFVFGDGHRATKWPLEVKVGDDGIPPMEETLNLMIEKLGSQVIGKMIDG